MEYLNVLALLNGYSAQAIIIAIISSALYKLIDKLTKGKLPIALKVYMPVIFSLIFNALYEIVFVTKAFSFSADFINKCMLSSSFSVILGTIIDRLIKNKPITSPEQMLIEGIIKQAVKPQNLTDCINSLQQILASNEDENQKITKITQIITDNALEEISSEDVISLAILLLQSYSTQ